MHDTILFEKILRQLKDLCKENKFDKITKIDITVSYDSHVYAGSLRDYITWREPDILKDRATIIIQRENIEEYTCVVNVVEGEIKGVK